MPLNMILWCSVMYFLIRSWIASSLLSACSRMSAASQKASATIAFSVVFGLAMESALPTIRNSNLLPVKAKGDVLFLSVASFWKSGRVLTPVKSLPPSLTEVASPVSISCVTTSSSCSPRKMEIIAGGASIGGRLAEQIRMSVHRPHNTCQHEKELHVLVGRIAGI